MEEEEKEKEKEKEKKNTNGHLKNSKRPNFWFSYPIRLKLTPDT
jgi:hypothetical protein